MAGHLCALLIHNYPELFKELEGVLKDLSVKTWNTKTVASAENLIPQLNPILVFIESSLWDTSYPQHVDLARKPDLALNVIVVGTGIDIELYLSAIKRGAFSFIAPPFTHDELNVVVNSAVMDARERRGTANGHVSQLIIGQVPGL